MLGPITGYAQEPVLPLTDACYPLVNIIDNISTYASVALEETPNIPADGLTRDESASIRLYTMEWTDGQRSLYIVLNETLKVADRNKLRPWFKYIKLFLSALVKIPCAPPQTIWRGVRRNVSKEFPHGMQVTWWSFSSCTTTLTVLENEVYLGTKGERTLFSIEVFNGKNIRAHSHFDNEDEVLMLPGTYMEVHSQMKSAPDLYIIHLKQEMPKTMLIEPPFEAVLQNKVHNEGLVDAKPVPGFQGQNGPAIGSWFRANNSEDGSNGRSWCGYNYYDTDNGFAPDILVMCEGNPCTYYSSPDNWRKYGEQYCGLEAEVTNIRTGLTRKIYISDAFAHEWVEKPGSINLMVESFKQLAGFVPSNKTQIIEVLWKLTGKRNNYYAFKG
ncbi:unnamed protein product [Adineta steineri]|uniref:NAD(P)(+)--arginine ADP-ribosyltransferase n=1 Tax=Adineta steineri TaxID=433720 RepID=A0A814L7D6_9BILA|nr:unnamed protein product [Adineta steineri]CAF3825971.1 unnamed protein product [Adineta steineri]